ncbi:3-hydroxyacyl-CoA dehydrogenase family protein [Altericroceibacterium spongiae]|uniref:3-hydroxyacyl-CoA dehydrogenase family protein n=1 Tax=Altericroceibacterium spongiae TaxID=2320269 RepID=A0A420EMS8_9SPHN|nr:3-hydroxyacyl-CoA dehydrogenase family protein [Altericroceibacterium spongiae]RKF22027.1 3-hydroxyacyl-CoA dehydrogenase family protein [Altericroceibacterium spongiae]
MTKKVGVVGAGLMGSEIALVFALAGHEVLLNDRDQSSLDRALARLKGLMEKGVPRSFFTEDQIEPTLSRITPALELDSFADREIVTEAVFEQEQLKTELLSQLDSIVSADCLIASNTSTIPIGTLAAAIAPERRNRFLGTHYFSPVSHMKLVEVIPGFDTSDATMTQIMALMSDIGKTPIAVKDVPGFAVNRMLHAFIIEAVRLVEEGVASPEDLDTACRLGLGHPIGPFALMDAVTSSLCVQAQEIMQDAYGERFRPPPLLKQRVRGGYPGGKGKPGWLPSS